MIGNRLKVTRQAAGLSLRALSNRIDNRVSAQAIGKYERDEALPRSQVLVVLAEVLNVSVAYLAGDSNFRLQAVSFRTKRVTSRREEDRIGAMVVKRLERYLAVEEILNMSSVNWDRPRLAPYPVINDLLEADRAASNMRHEWGLGLNPIYDMSELMEDRGVKVFFCPLEEGIDGLTAHVRREDQPDARVIVVSQSVSRDRQRFTIGHEIAHMVLDVSADIDREEAAHRFAGAFLMPEEALWSKVGKHRPNLDWREFLALKLAFGMSVQAITHRCRNLGIISQAHAGRLFDTFDEIGWGSPPYREPLDTEGSRIGRFEQLCLRALAEGAISEARASELLEVPVEELNRDWEWMLNR